MKIQGWNDFYDGWIAYLIGFDKDDTKNDAWKEGWDTANETDCVKETSDIIRGSIKRNYISIDDN